MDNRHNIETDDRKRLEKLMAGQTTGRYITDSEIAHTMKSPVRLSRFILIVIWIIFLAYYAYLNLSNPPAFTYNFNPVSKIILRVKSFGYMKDTYPEFEDTMDIDMSSGMLKHKNGYAVTCHDVHNRFSTVVVYYDKSFNILYDSPQIKQTE